MSKCGKGCMPECEYFTTGGCISPFNCPYKIETGYINFATSIPTYMGQYNGMSDDDIERCLERLAMGKATDVMNFDYAGTFAYIQRLKAKNAELKSSLTHANEECLKWHERAQNLLKDSGGSISGYEKKISALQAENAALRERLDKAIILPCKLGDKLYFVNKYLATPKIQEHYITAIEIFSSCVKLYVEDGGYFILDGDNIYFNPEAAEARLKGEKE